ncbi:leukocyte elastase inhibitor-like [Spodoptera frugiperda]|uniref:Leukocyte elastase inhibitor-like n=1 Tax=Spodoptera frugiperda TaxID=7108 RepID=A0A9R0ERR7_SPOFR|nr:leukocyte elastase inhibitor-like [Spodoptera frugiperda]
MRLSLLLLAVCVARCVHGLGTLDDIIGIPGKLADHAGGLLHGLLGGNANRNVCDRNVYQDYSKAVTSFHHKLYTSVAARSNDHFVFSPYTVWLSLSALAEGADPSVQRQIFASLYLPEENCIRKKFYEIAANVEQSGRDVIFDRRRILLLDEDLRVNPAWGQTVKALGLLKAGFASIKNNPRQTVQRARKFIGTQANIPLSGNSVILDALEYQGLWTTAFPEADIQRQPFYNEHGLIVGNVDMMHIRKRVRLMQAPFLGARVVELPVGVDGRYTMLIAVGTGNNVLRNAMAMFMGSILEIFSLLQMSLVPLDVAVPRFSISSEFDIRAALEDFGVKSFWRDPLATKYISEPSALPGNFIQRVLVSVDSQGVEPPPQRRYVNNIIGRGQDFIANRPFLFALFDTATKTCIYAGAYSKPNPSG